MKLFNITEVGKTIAWHDNQADQGEMAGQAVRAINAAVDALGADLSREGIEAWIRMRYEDAPGFERAVQQILDRESPSSEEEEEAPREREWDSGYNYEGPQRDEEKERCVTCGGTGKQLVGDNQLVFDCPDCKDEEEEDDKWGDIDLEQEKREEDARDVEAEMRAARQELHGSDEEEELSLETQIGGHDIKLLAGGSDSNPFGNNPIAVIEFDGTRYEVYKQGMINIWAFKERPSLSNEEGKEFDTWMDSNYELASKL